VVAEECVPSLVLAGGVGTATADLPLMEGRSPGADAPRAFVCRGYVCDQPTDSPDELRRQLRGARAGP
jgi:uncharacterized protein YyaL (SSP411 family)